MGSQKPSEELGIWVAQTCTLLGLHGSLSALAEQGENLTSSCFAFQNKEFKTRLGIFLHKSELGSDTGNVGKFEWGSKHSKEGKSANQPGAPRGKEPDLGREPLKKILGELGP